MSNIDKQVLCVPKRKKHDWGAAVMHTCDFCDHYAMTITTEDGEHSCANCCDAEYVGALTCALEIAIERAEAAEKRIAELTEFLMHIKKCLVRNSEYAPLSHEEIDTLLGIRADGKAA